MAQKIKSVEKVEALTPEENSAPIAKPGELDLDKFKAKRTAAVANVETLPSALPVHNMSAAKDFVRLHPDEQNYWSDELCFVDVPIKGQKHNTLHLIDRRIGTSVSRSRRDQTLSSRARHQAGRRVLPLRSPHAEYRQQLERHKLGGV